MGNLSCTLKCQRVWLIAALVGADMLIVRCRFAIVYVWQQTDSPGASIAHFWVDECPRRSRYIETEFDDSEEMDWSGPRCVC